MKIDVAHFSNALSKELVQNKVAIVIDIFRATSVIVTALASGAKNIVVFSEVDEALRAYNEAKDINIILGGERLMHKISGFHYGNSPQSYIIPDVYNKTIFLTTTNGTKAIEFCKEAQETYISSFLNCTYLADYLSHVECDICILCAGSKGEFSLEDCLCAGMLVKLISESKKNEMNDYAIAALKLYESSLDNLGIFLSGSKAYQNLLSSGYKKDINFCLRNNIYNVLPKYNGKKINLFELG
jgi:2-phosphosulfolactate phosphatase